MSLREGLKTALGHRINNTKGLLARPLYGSDVDPMIDAILDYLEANRDAVVEASYSIEGVSESEAHHEAVTLIRRIALSRVVAALRIQEIQP